MAESHTRLARLLRTTPEIIEKADAELSAATGKAGAIDAVLAQNQTLVDRILAEHGLSRSDSADVVYGALIKRLAQLDSQLFELLDKPNLAEMSLVCGKLCEVALKVYTPPRGMFIKRERVVSLLEKYKPENLVQHFGYSDIATLIEKEGFASVVSALRFTQDTGWMHAFFDLAYSELTPDDFEEREVEIKILDPKWLGVADKFLEKKYHNVSHLKEYGVIFVIPLKIDTQGETLRLFTLLMHYLHEVPFYTERFRAYMKDADFVPKLQSLLRGDVSEGPLPAPSEGKKAVWRVIQRYLAKDSDKDPRLGEPHINPEAEHWYKVGEDLGKVGRALEKEAFDLGYWTGLDAVGDFFKDSAGNETFVSFNLIDLVMSSVTKGITRYTYHHQEAMWNRFFSEYVGRDKMNELFTENIIKGSVEV